MRERGRERKCASQGQGREERSPAGGDYWVNTNSLAQYRVETTFKTKSGERDESETISKEVLGKLSSTGVERTKLPFSIAETEYPYASVLGV